MNAPDAPAAPKTSVERVMEKESFAPDEPLPAFTFPAIDEATKQELLKRVEEARAAPATSVERVAAKESFAADEPLPAFTFPVLDEEKKQELLRRVEEGRAPTAQVPVQIPEAATIVRTDVLQPPPAALTATLPTPPARPDARSPGGRPRREAAALARQWVDAACTFIDRNRSRLPPRIRGPLNQVPAGVLLATFAFAIFMGGLLLIVVVRSGKGEAAPQPSASTSAPPPQESTVEQQIEEAKKQGTPELVKLAERFPNEPRVWLELAAAFFTKGDHMLAVRAVGKALAADPKANEAAVASTVLASAIRKRAMADAALELLSGPMGPAGATVLYDLSIDPAVALALRSRTEEWIRSDAFKKVATPDVLIAAALRYAKSCSDRHDLLPRAATDGGRRVLDYLKVATAKTGCGRRGRDDCFPCLHKDDALKDAIAAIEKRLGGK